MGGRLIGCAAGLIGLALTLLGAVGAHAVLASAATIAEMGAQGRVFLVNRDSWNTAMMMGYAHTLACLAALALPFGVLLRRIAAGAFLLGTLLFSGSIIVKSLLLAQFVAESETGPLLARAAPIGALAPFGGVTLMIGWVLLAASALLAADPKSPRAPGG